MPFGPAIAAVGSVAGGLIASSAAKGSASTQAGAANNAAAATQQQFQQTQQNLSPYLASGTNALANLNYALGTSNGVPGAGTNQTPLSQYLSSGGSTSLGNGYTLQPGANGTYNIIDKNGNMHWQGVTANTPISDLQASVGDNVQSTSTSQGVSPAIAQNVANGQLTAPYNGGQPFQFTPQQSGLIGTGTSTPVAPFQQPAYGAAGFGSPTVNQNGTLQAPGAFSYAAYQAPAPYSPIPFQQPAPFTFGQNQTGIPTAGSAQANGLPPNSGVGTAGVGANGISTYNAPAPFNYTAQDFQASPGYAYALQQAQQSSQNAAAAAGGGFSGNLLQALQTNAVGLADQDFNSQEALAQQAYGLNSTNSQNAFAQNYNSSIGAYDTNFNTALQSNNINNQYGLAAYNTNAQVGQGAYNTNFNNALNTYDTNLNAGNAAYNTNFANANNVFQQGFNNNQAQNAQLYAMLSGQAGAGQNAAVQQGGFGAQAVGQQNNAQMSGAAATAAGQVGSANALSQSLTGLGNAAGTASLLQPNFLNLLNPSTIQGAAYQSPLNTSSNPLGTSLQAYPNLSDPQYAFNVSQQQQTTGGF